MDDKKTIRFVRHLDLCDSKHSNLEDEFATLINKMRELCAPAAVQLAGESDWFNITHSLEPGSENSRASRKKQQVGEEFGRYQISPIPTTVRGTASRCSSSARYTPSSTSKECTRRAASEPRSPKRQLKVSFSKPARNRSHVKLDQLSRPASRAVDSRASSCTSIKSNESRKQLNRRYSSMRLCKSPDPLDKLQAGFDRLFDEPQDASYPFANPMPACMLTENNIDNLREIIVSALHVEWKMLTPVRPTNQYEEGYFDKLIWLHRQSYKARVSHGESSIDKTSKLRGESKRNPYLFQYASKPKTQGSSQMSLGVRLKRRFKSRSRAAGNKSLWSSSSSSPLNGNGSNVDPQSPSALNIPTLCITSDQENNDESTTSESHNVDDKPSVDSRSTLVGKEVENEPTRIAEAAFEQDDFCYDNYSRFSKKMRIKNRLLEQQRQMLFVNASNNDDDGNDATRRRGNL